MCDRLERVASGDADTVTLADLGSLLVGPTPTTDFLWQRSPFLLSGGGDGTVQGSGIDFILPYWMARYYGGL